MKKTIIWLVLLGVLLVVLLGVSPYYKLYTFKYAHDKQDYTPIIEAIDFQTLRPNLKAQLYAKTDKSIQTLQDTAIKSAMQQVIHHWISKAVDGAITADNLQKLADGQISRQSEALAGLLLLIERLYLEPLAVNDILGDDLPSALAKGQQALSNSQNQTIPEAFYCGINCFYVKTTVLGQPMTIMMTRHAFLDWKIDNIILS